MAKVQRGGRRAPRAAVSLVERVRAWAQASVWTSLLGRAGLAVVALFALAWIGRAATAATASSALEPTESLAMLEASALSIGAPPTAPWDAPSVASSALTAPPAAVAEAPVAEVPVVAAPTPLHARATPDDPVYLNVASVEECRRLPGAGPKRAAAIVALRARMGRFRRVEDLLRVKGIGRATLRKWRPLIRLDVPPAASATDAGAGAANAGPGA